MPAAQPLGNLWSATQRPTKKTIVLQTEVRPGVWGRVRKSAKPCGCRGFLRADRLGCALWAVPSVRANFFVNSIRHVMAVVFCATGPAPNI